ncbi:MAG: UDP-glucose 4-epimerase GalE [Candidatus Cyclobacteriaceae bacterium M2_1C_046]
MKKNKILVTGGCGYIGSQTIIQILRNTNYKVISADNFSNSTLLTLERIEKITGEKIKNYEVDLADLNSTDRIFQENKDLLGVIHFAALKSVPESVEKPLLYYRNNMDSLLNILECCEKHDVEHHIFSSSCSVYGNVAELPVDEHTPFAKAESPYAHTKAMGEEIIEQFSKNSRTRNIALRYFNPVGSDETGLIGEDPVSNDKPNNLVPFITRTAAGIYPKLTVFGGDYSTRDGSCVRDYIHVMDIANAHIQALEYLVINKEIKFDVFNLGTGQGVTVLEAIKAFENESGVELNYEIGPRRQGDVEAIYSDSKKAKDKLNWQPVRSIKEMMSSAWKWQQQLLQEQNR